MNQQLVSYIRQQLKVNEPRESIMNTLIAQGWKQADLDMAFAAVEGEQSVAAVPPVVPVAASFAQSFGAAEPIAQGQSKFQMETQFQQPAQSVDQPQVQEQPQAKAFPAGFPGDEQFDESDGGQSSPLKTILAFVGLGFGVLSLVSFFVPWVGLSLAVIGSILCIVGVLGPKKVFSFIGLGLCVIGLVGFGVKIR